MGETVKVLGWGKCSVTEAKDSRTYDDIMDGSTTLEVEEGEEMEALIEGGSREGYKRKPDKYTLTYKRRIGDPAEATPGFTEDAGDVTVDPENAGAVGVTLKGCSKHVAMEFSSTDGLMATYTWKTNGTTDASGSLNDITFSKKGDG